MIVDMTCTHPVPTDAGSNSSAAVSRANVLVSER